MTTEENAASTALGSASWIGADEYDGDEFYERAIAFFAAVKWDELVSISSRLRHGISCQLGEKYSIGHFNMVRQVVFADGISWVARLRLPPLDAVFGRRERLDSASILKSEVASMKFLKYVTTAFVELKLTSHLHAKKQIICSHSRSLWLQPGSK